MKKEDINKTLNWNERTVYGIVLLCVINETSIDFTHINSVKDVTKTLGWYTEKELEGYVGSLVKKKYIYLDTESNDDCKGQLTILKEIETIKGEKKTMDFFSVKDAMDLADTHHKDDKEVKEELEIILNEIKKCASAGKYSTDIAWFGFYDLINPYNVKRLKELGFTIMCDVGSSSVITWDKTTEMK